MITYKRYWLATPLCGPAYCTLMTVYGYQILLDTSSYNSFMQLVQFSWFYQVYCVLQRWWKRPAIGTRSGTKYTRFVMFFVTFRTSLQSVNLPWFIVCIIHISMLSTQQHCLVDRDGTAPSLPACRAGVLSSITNSPHNLVLVKGVEPILCRF